MTNFDFTLVLPEIFLSICAMLLMMVGVYKKKQEGNGFETILAVLALFVSILITFNMASTGQETSASLFISDSFAVFFKVTIALVAIVVLLLNLEYKGVETRLSKFEYPVLVLFAVVGMFVMVSANDLMTLYLGLELQSLSLYVIAAMERSKLKPSEAGLKYFILGAVASGILLYGASLIYGFSGSMNFDEIAQMVSQPPGESNVNSVGILTGSILVLVALFFKISAVPFHMWTPDVYEGVPKPVVAFFATAPKVAAIALLVRFSFGAFGSIADQLQQVFVVVAAASMVLGSFAAMKQVNIKRLLAYSSIGHFGFILVGLAAGGAEGISAVVLYVIIYLTMNLGVFACVMLMIRNGEHVEDIRDLAGLGKSHPLLACIIAILMLSMAGIPPLAGFMGKFFVFAAAIKAGLYPLAVIGVIASVVGAFYYIRIIKIMYFDTSKEQLDKGVTPFLKIVLGLSAIFNILYFAYPMFLLHLAEDVSKVLF